MSAEQSGGGESIRSHYDPNDPTTWLRQLHKRPGPRSLARLCVGVREQLYGPVENIDHRTLRVGGEAKKLPYPEIEDPETGRVLRELVTFKPYPDDRIELHYYISTAFRNNHSVGLLHAPHGTRQDPSARWMVDSGGTSSLTYENPLQYGARKATNEQIGFMAIRFVEAVILGRADPELDEARSQINLTRADIEARWQAAKQL